jgi:hypothetical protein
MKLRDIRIKARTLGIRPNGMDKTDLIRAVQRSEDNFACYATDSAQQCGETYCLWRTDCRDQNMRRQVRRAFLKPSSISRSQSGDRQQPRKRITLVQDRSWRR